MSGARFGSKQGVRPRERTQRADSIELMIGSPTVA